MRSSHPIALTRISDAIVCVTDHNGHRCDLCREGEGVRAGWGTRFGSYPLQDAGFKTLALLSAVKEEIVNRCGSARSRVGKAPRALSILPEGLAGLGKSKYSRSSVTYPPTSGSAPHAPRSQHRHALGSLPDESPAGEARPMIRPGVFPSHQWGVECPHQYYPLSVYCKLYMYKRKLPMYSSLLYACITLKCKQ